MAGLLVLGPSALSFPTGYRMVFYADGLEEGLHYAAGTPSTDERIEHPPFPVDDPCLGFLRFPTDFPYGDEFIGNAHGYGLQFISDFIAEGKEIVLHAAGKGNAKGEPTCRGLPLDATYRISGALDFTVTSGGVGPPLAIAGEISGVPGDGFASLSWTAGVKDLISDFDFATVNYVLLRGTLASRIPITGVLDELSYIDSGLTNGVTYYYQVSAGINLGSGEHIHGDGTPGTYSLEFLSNVIAITPLAGAGDISFDGVRYRVGTPASSDPAAAGSISLDEVRWRVGTPADVAPADGIDFSRVRWRPA